MKWRLSSDSFPQKEISDTKTMSFAENEKTEIIAGNKFTPSKYNKNETGNKSTIQSTGTGTSSSYKPRTSNDIIAELELKRNLVPSHTHLHNNYYHDKHDETFNQISRQRTSLDNHVTASNEYDNPSITINDNNSQYEKSSQRNTKNQIFVISSNQMAADSGNCSPDGTQINTNIISSSSSTPTSISEGIGGDGKRGRQTTSPIGVTTVSSTTISNHNHNMDDMILDNINYNNTTSNHSKNNDFQPYVNSTANPSTTGSINKSGSTAKLLPASDDQSSTQSKCSVLRNLVFCVCLNISYANIVRFPRELDQHGLAFLVPYFVLLILVGLPIVLLEIAVGQFLGQGSANTWRSSPILKGACMVTRFASWLASIWISLQSILAVLYIGMLTVKSIPFYSCVHQLKIEQNHYKSYADNGQDCLLKTFLTPVWKDPFYFGLLILILIVIWVIAMLCTHNSRVFRRFVFCFGLVGLILLISLTGWEVYKSLEKQYFPELWPFDEIKMIYSNLWFNALVQVIYSTNIGFGIMPVITGKFLYKGDAVRTSVVYICFNLLINAIAVTLFMVQYDNKITQGAVNGLPELKSLTSIYDKTLIDYGNPLLSMEELIMGKIAACWIYALVVISSIISIAVGIYTSSRLIPRHANYILSLVALTTSVAVFVMPNFAIPRILDSRIVGTLAITALVFELIATVWIYGLKNIYTDLEFSIGRPIFKSWLYLWCIAPVILTGILLWWCVDDDQYDLLYQYVPRWAPIGFVLLIIFIVAGVEIFRQVDYNFFGMICEAAKPAKEWGPADPLARHAWKQWRSVCQDTGQRDFTLRRRGTRDYTHSIKKGQYSTSTGKYGLPTQNWKSASTPGNSSPNYSGSMFGDSAIEEDFGIDKYSGVSQNFVPFNQNTQPQNIDNNRPLRYSNRTRRISQEKLKNQAAVHEQNHKEIMHIRRLSNDRACNTGNHHSTRIEITPSVDSISYATINPMARTKSNASNNGNNKMYKYAVNPSKELAGQNKTAKNSLDHICWRKFSVNSEEYSTEL